MMKDTVNVMSSNTNVGEPEQENLTLLAGEHDDRDITLDICPEVGEVDDEIAKSIKIGTSEVEDKDITITDQEDEIMIVGNPVEAGENEDTDVDIEVGAPDDRSTALPLGESMAENGSSGPKLNQHENEDLPVTDTDYNDGLTLDMVEDNNILIEEKDDTTDVLEEAKACSPNTSKKLYKNKNPITKSITKPSVGLSKYKAKSKTKGTGVLSKSEATDQFMIESKLNDGGSTELIKNATPLSPSKRPRQKRNQTSHGGLEGESSDFEPEDKVVEDLTSDKDEGNEPDYNIVKEIWNFFLNNLTVNSTKWSKKFCVQLLALLMIITESSAFPTSAKWKRVAFESITDLTNCPLSIRKGLKEICFFKPLCPAQMTDCTDGDSFAVLTNNYILHLFTPDLDTEAFSMKYGPRLNMDPSRIEYQSIDVVKAIWNYYKAIVTTTMGPNPANNSLVVGQEDERSHVIIFIPLCVICCCFFIWFLWYICLRKNRGLCKTYQPSGCTMMLKKMGTIPNAKMPA
ncbi:uncharacterized protein LOC142106730 [Mixophyes fleayi]|uniref:uncharacterized protein LOC142106730 n=1 Tax=Mixophyes fleayi TaxID=3061075 RepID=UPI003F4D963C